MQFSFLLYIVFFIMQVILYVHTINFVSLVNIIIYATMLVCFYTSVLLATYNYKK